MEQQQRRNTQITVAVSGFVVGVVFVLFIQNMSMQSTPKSQPFRYTRLDFDCSTCRPSVCAPCPPSTCVRLAHSPPPPPPPPPLPVAKCLPKKVLRLLKDVGCGIGNMATPPVWNDVDNRRNLLVIDVGANVGNDWTFSAVAQRGHTVLSFEPVSGPIGKFKQTLLGLGSAGVVVDITPGERPKLPTGIRVGNRTQWPRDQKGRVFLFPAAASNHTGKQRIHVLPSDEMSSLNDQTFVGIRSASTEDIALVSLDDVVAEDVHLLKIDTQGHELAVLQGAEQLLTHHYVHMIELEFWPKGMQAGNTDGYDVLMLLHRHGFLCFDWSGNHVLKPSRPSDFRGFVDSFEQYNNGKDPYGYWDELMCINTNE